MKKIYLVIIILTVLLITSCVASAPVVENDNKEIEKTQENEEIKIPEELREKEEIKKEPEITFEYPEAVRGIYVTGHSAGASRFEKLLKLVDDTDLNAMVIDIKDDYGNITFKVDGTPFEELGKNFIKDPKELIKVLAENKIYPIARIVVFKDSKLAEKYPEYSFKINGKIWRNGKEEAFVNPFNYEVWEYNVEIAKIAVELGFQEIQFDYVRFPEGFEKREKYMEYSLGDYTEEKLLPRLKKEIKKIADDESTDKSKDEISDKNIEKNTDVLPKYDPVQARVMAVTDFVEYAYNELEPLGVKISVDIFGYTATRSEAPGIGQSFTEVSKHVDVISSMIYPSHWSFGYFGIPKPDKEPYRLVKEYVIAEKEKFTELESPPVSRPWIQDFTATWLKKGNYIRYGKEEVEAQIRALNEGGIDEFLLWNPTNKYTLGVDYTPDLK
jgi:hypothetical protein